MTYQDIHKGQRYGSRLVTAIYPAGSDWAGPGLDQPNSPQDVVAYQDFATATRTSCSARAFCTWVARQTAD